jgi:hypothetical protein
MNAVKHSLNFSCPATVEMMANSAAGDCDDFQIIVLINCFECKKQKKNNVSIKTPFNVCILYLKTTSPKLYNSHPICEYSSNSDRTSTITSHRTFNSASNFDPDVLFLPFTCHKILWYSELNCNVRAKLCALVQSWLISDHEYRNVLHPARPLRSCNF